MKCIVLIYVFLFSVISLAGQPVLIKEVSADRMTRSGFTADSKHIYVNRSGLSTVQIFELGSGNEILNYDFKTNCQWRSLPHVEVNKNNGTSIISECCENYGKTSCQFTQVDLVKGEVKATKEIRSGTLQVSFDNKNEILRTVSEHSFYEYNFKTFDSKTLSYRSIFESIFLSDGMSVLIANPQSSNKKMELYTWPDRIKLAEFASNVNFGGFNKKMLNIGSRFLVFYKSTSGEVFEIIDIAEQKSILPTIKMNLVTASGSIKEAAFISRTYKGYSISKLDANSGQFKEVASFENRGTDGNHTFGFEVVSSAMRINGNFTLGVAKGWNMKYFAGTYDLNSKLSQFIESDCETTNFSFFEPSSDGQYFLCFDESKVSWSKHF